MVTHRDPAPGHRAPEDDPTGIRALLSSLPDPGPMPQDLVARITASLAAEQAARQEAGGAEAGGGQELRGPGATVVPLRRRALWRTAGIAAAAAVVGLTGAGLLTRTGPGDLSAMFGGSESAMSQAESGSAARDAGGGPSPLGRLSGPGEVRVHHSNTAYRAASLGDQAGQLLAEPGPELAPLAAEAPGIGPIGTERGIRACLGSLGVDAATAVTADLGSLDGLPAAVLVVTTDTGHTAYAVTRSCSADSPGLLAGPADVPLR